MPRYIPYHPPKPLAQAHHFHPVSSDSLDQPYRCIDILDQREDLYVGWEAHGLGPGFTKHRDGLLDESNICLFYYGPLVAEIFAAWEDERNCSGLSDSSAIFKLDPELAKLEPVKEVEKERPKTPTLVLEVQSIGSKGRRIPLTTVRPLSASSATNINHPLAWHNTVGDDVSSSSLTSFTSIVSRSSDPSTASPTQTVAPTFFMPTRIQLSVFRRSLDLDPQISQKDRLLSSMPSWEEIDRQANVRQAYQREKSKQRAKRKRRVNSAASTDAATDSDGPGSSSKRKTRRRTIVTSDSSGLPSLSSSIPSPSPMPEKRDYLHFRDSESLTPLPDSPCPSPFIRA